jgi:hypothetical protein
MSVSLSKLQTLFMKQVEGLELEILELQNNLTLKTYNLGKSCQKLVDGAVSIVEKF